MTEPNNTERDLAILLDKAIQQATFLVSHLVQSSRAPFQCTGSQLRQMFYTNSGYARMQLAGATTQLEENLVGELTTALHVHLEKYVVDKRIGNGLSQMMGGTTPNPLVPDFARYLVRAAAFLEPKRVARLLCEWARGEPLHYNTCMVLSGLSVDEPMSMHGGIHFSTLPKSSNALANELPFGIDFYMGIMNMAGATKVAIDCQDYPVLFRPDEWPDIQSRVYGSSRDFSYARFCEALGLACNRHVSWIITWLDFGDLAVFGNGIPSGHTTGPDTRFYSSGPPISQEQLDHAGDLLTNRRKMPNPALNIPIHRWMNSKRSGASLADRFIDLRIALEALYLSDIKFELGFRLATRGAWHLGVDFQERHHCQKTLKKAYDRASTAVHAGSIKPTEENRNLLTTAQDLCRKGILKRLGENQEPNWNELILGEELDAEATKDDEPRP